MNSRGHIVVMSDQIVHFDDTNLHRVGLESTRIDAYDRAILDCLMRGESELEILSGRLRDFGVGGGQAELVARVREISTAAGTYLGLVPPLVSGSPDIIVLDFNRNWASLDSKKLVPKLRRKHRVLHLGLDKQVTPDHEDSITLEKRSREFSGSAFLYVQWARGIVRYFPDAVLVMSGPQDLVLFGDFAERPGTVVPVPQDWPASGSVADLYADEGDVIDPEPWLRELYYAIRMNPQSEYHLFSRAFASAFGALELFALRHAKHLLVTRADQAASLRVLGRTLGRLSICGPTEEPQSCGAAIGLDTRMLIVANHENEVARLIPLFAGAAELRREHGVTEIGLLAHGELVQVQFTGDRCSVGPWPGLRPSLEGFAVAWIVAGMLRDFQPAFGVLSKGIPSLFVPEAEPSTLGRLVPEECWFRNLDVATIVAETRECLAGGPARRARLAAAGRELLQQADPVAAISALVSKSRSPAGAKVEAVVS